MEITSSLRRAVQQRPHSLLTRYGQRSRSVEDTADRVARLAGVLRSLQVGPDVRVAVFANNSDRYYEVLFAVAWAGGVVVPLNTRWSPAELESALADCTPRVVVVDDQALTTRERTIVFSDDRYSAVYCGDGPVPAWCLAYEQLVADAERLPDTRRHDNDLYGIFYTGGTSGRAKGVMLSHRNLLTSALGAVASGEFISQGGRLLHAAPMFHIADISTWIAGNIVGSEHVIVSKFDADEVVGIIEKQKVTDMLLVPTMLQLLIDCPRSADADMSSLRHLVYGGAPSTLALIERARAQLPALRFMQGYGMTELSPVVTLLLPDEHDEVSARGSVGKAAVHCELRVAGPDDVEVGCKAFGEIQARGDHVMRGYWNQPEATQAALTADGWLRSGDAGFMNQDGYLFVTDRLKDMIITGGENVASLEVESALARHPAVASCAVIGVPDDVWGERVHAVVVLKPGRIASAEDLQAYLRTPLATYKVPRSVTFVTELPVSGAGKVLKRQLRLDAAKTPSKPPERAL